MKKVYYKLSKTSGIIVSKIPEFCATDCKRKISRKETLEYLQTTMPDSSSREVARLYNLMLKNGLMKEGVMQVASNFCYQCPYFVGIDEKERYVICNYDKE